MLARRALREMVRGCISGVRSTRRSLDELAALGMSREADWPLLRKPDAGLSSRRDARERDVAKSCPDRGRARLDVLACDDKDGVEDASWSWGGCCLSGRDDDNSAWEYEGLGLERAG